MANSGRPAEAVLALRAHASACPRRVAETVARIASYLGVEVQCRCDGGTLRALPGESAEAVLDWAAKDADRTPPTNSAECVGGRPAGGDTVTIPLAELLRAGSGSFQFDGLPDWENLSNEQIQRVGLRIVHLIRNGAALIVQREGSWQITFGPQTADALENEGGVVHRHDELAIPIARIVASLNHPLMQLADSGLRIAVNLRDQSWWLEHGEEAR
jgi:hypothetical protein